MLSLNSFLLYIPSPIAGIQWIGRVVAHVAQGTAHIASQVAQRVLGELVAVGCSVGYGTITLFDTITGTSKVGQLAFALKKVLHKEIMVQLEKELGPDLDKRCSVWLNDYLDNTLASLIGNFISDRSIDRLFKAFTNSVRTHGPLNWDSHVEAFANELKALYADYVDRQRPILEKDVKAVSETKRTIHTIIETCVQAMKRESTLQAKFNVFSDAGQCASIVQKALNQTKLYEKGKLSPQRVTRFLHYAMPREESFLAGVTAALSPTTPRATSALCNLVFSTASLKMAGRPGLTTCVRDTSPSKATHIATQVAQRVLGSLVAAGVDVVYGFFSIFSDITGISQASQLAFFLKPMLRKEALDQLEKHFGQDVNGNRSRWLNDYLGDILPRIISSLVSKPFVDRLVKTCTNSVRVPGLLTSDVHVESVAHELKALYADYSDRRYPRVEGKGRAVNEAKRIIHLVIDDFARAIKSAPTPNAKFNVFTDSAKLATIIEKVLIKAQLVKDGKLSPQGVTALFQYMPRIENFLTGTAALSPTTPRATSALCNLASSLLSQAAVDSPHS